VTATGFPKSSYFDLLDALRAVWNTDQVDDLGGIAASHFAFDAATVVEERAL
jgi:hypothetical protein